MRLKILKSQKVNFFGNKEKLSWKNKKPNISLLEKINKFTDKVKYIKNPLLFYVVVKKPPQNNTHVYLNYATYPAWWNIGDKDLRYIHIT